jgi:hypothetical protein
MKIPSTKKQISNKYQGSKFKIQNGHDNFEDSIKGSVCFGYWNFEFGYYLEFGAWDLEFYCFTIPFEQTGIEFT